MAKVLVLGGDGFCGWPTALHLSAQGHEVHIVDNFSRRAIDLLLGTSSLTPILPLTDRVLAWHRITGKRIDFTELDCAKDYQGFLEILKAFQPDAIVHFAEQRSAPYSMKSSTEKRYTVENNVSATHNVLCAIVESGLDAHLIHLGTMGVYGYKGSVPEGYADFEGRKIIYPPDPGSVYHTTKVLDEFLFYFYNKNNDLKITDLHQGIVWGTQTCESAADEALINRFDYDGDYGTVLNRFLVQAVMSYPLTVYGTGGQTRAFINIQDTVYCVQRAVENPPDRVKVRIVNQMTETYSVQELAGLIRGLTGIGIAYMDNPRKEAEKNDLIVSHETVERWIQPVTLETGLLNEIMETAQKYKDRIDVSKIAPSSIW